MFHLRDTAFLMMFSIMSSIAPTLIAPKLNAAELPSSCNNPQILLDRDQIRQGQGRVGETHCYRLDLVSSGLLHLDVSVAAADAWKSGKPVSGPRIEVLGPAQRQTLGRTASEYLILAGAGATFVEVRAEDPRQPLPAYRLASRFVEVGKSETDDELEIEPEKSETDDELEIEPEKSETDDELEIEPEKSETDDELEIEPEKMAGIESPFVCGSIAKSETDDELEIEPEKSETDDELEIEPEKLTFGGEHDVASAPLRGTWSKPGKVAEKTDCDWIRPVLDRLCHADTADDDHGDTLACSTPIEQRAQGELDNGWGDDADLFRFEVESWQTVEILTAGHIETHHTLFDRRGQRLAAAGLGADSRLIRTLGPGTYFVRVEALGSAGSYTLSVNELDR